MDNNQNRQPKRAIADVAEFLNISMQAVHKQLKTSILIVKRREIKHI